MVNNANSPENADNIIKIAENSNIGDEVEMDKIESKPVEISNKPVDINRDESNVSTKAVLLYESPDWNEKVLEFFASNPDAKEFSDDIAKIIYDDEGIAGLDNCLMVAYGLAKSKKLKSPSALMSDSEFVSNNILNSEDIKAKVLESFLGGVIERKKLSPTLASSSSNATMVTAPKKIKTLDEAREVLFRLL